MASAPVKRAQWGNSLEFILTIIGYAVGLGAVWRFPFLVFKHGGPTFILPFFLMLILVGIPIFFMEISIGQFTALSPTHVFTKMTPLFYGLGYSATLINLFIAYYYNVVIAYCIYYFVFSIRAELPWTHCDSKWTDCFKRTNLSSNCTEDLIPFKDNITGQINIKSPSELYFYNNVLQISNGIQNLGNLVSPVVLCLLASWIIIFAALSKGVQSLGKISYFTATFPYLMVTILIIKGALLDGSSRGIYEYIGNFDGNKLLEPGLWKDATVQVFYALSACSGGLISMSSFNPFKSNVLRDAFLVPILDGFTGFYSGFAIFTVLGNMYVTKCVDSFANVTAQGPELSFVVYPEGISLMGKVAPLFSVFFFLMMLSLGFGTEFSIMEHIMSTFIDIFHKVINTKRRVLITRGLICIVIFLLEFPMATQGGIYVLTLLDDVVGGYPLLIVGLLQFVSVAWIYGADRFSKDIEDMIGKKPAWFWNIWKISWKFVTPLLLLFIIIASIIMPSSPTKVNRVSAPPYAQAIGWAVVVFILLPIPVMAIVQLIKAKYDWRSLLRPLPGYYENRNRNRESLSNDGKGVDNPSFRKAEEENTILNDMRKLSSYSSVTSPL